MYNQNIYELDMCGVNENNRWSISTCHNIITEPKVKSLGMFHLSDTPFSLNVSNIHFNTHFLTHTF